MFDKKYVLTVPNAITIVGLFVTVVGATRINTVPGIVLIALGRSMDIVDGHIARKLGQSSSFGAMLDATADKIGSLAIIIAEWYFGIAPVLILVSFILLNLANAITALLIAKVKGVLTIPPSRGGKHAMFLQNISLGAFAIAFVLAEGLAKSFFWGSGIILGITGVFILGLPATIGYYKRVYVLTKSRQ